MSQDAFKPVAYLNRACPFCFRFMTFLREGELLDQFELRAYTPGSADEASVREELSAHFEKLSFPTVQTAPGEFLAGTDALIARYAPSAARPVEEMPLLSYYMAGLFPAIGQLFRENMELKQRA